MGGAEAGEQFLEGEAEIRGGGDAQPWRFRGGSGRDDQDGGRAQQPEDNEAFGFQTPSPCLLLKRKTLSTTGRAVEYVEGTFRGDAYAYRLTLRA